MEDERTLRAWLARVVTNLARLAARRNVRRERREEVAARPEEVAPAHEAVERAGMLQYVLDAVLELDEPYRSTVLLRFFDGLDSDEIGRRTGASAVAVRKRLSRGLERLRKKLDHEHGGDREVWRAAFLPWALARPEAVAPPWGAGRELAGASGGLHAALAAAAVLALAGTSALVAASLQGGGDARAASPREPIEAAQADMPGVRRAAELAEPAPLQASEPRSVAWIVEVPLEDTRQPGPTTTVEPLEPAGSTLAGRVVDLAGFGVAGASIRAESGPALATSARDGSFEIALGDPSELAGASLEVRAADLATLRAALVPAALPVPHGEGGAPAQRLAQKAQLLIVALPAVDLSGLVLDASGAPVAGARIALDVPDAAFADLWLALDGTRPVPRETTTDEAGQFELAGLATHADLGLLVSAHGLPELRVPVPAHSVEGLCLRFPGDGPAWLEGLVLLPGGAPAAGARVRAGSAWAIADGDGHYRVSGGPRAASVADRGRALRLAAGVHGPRRRRRPANGPQTTAVGAAGATRARARGPAERVAAVVGPVVGRDRCSCSRSRVARSRSRAARSSPEASPRPAGRWLPWTMGSTRVTRSGPPERSPRAPGPLPTAPSCSKACSTAPTACSPSIPRAACARDPCRSRRGRRRPSWRRPGVGGAPAACSRVADPWRKPRSRPCSPAPAASSRSVRAPERTRRAASCSPARAGRGSCSSSTRACARGRSPPQARWGGPDRSA